MSSRTARKPTAAGAAAEPPSIETLRARMDEINLKILRLVSLRASLAVEIGRLKHNNGGEVYQPVRELAIIEKMIAENQGPLTDEQVKRIYVEIISACRALEHEPRVAFLGPEHTYSHEAARMRFGSSVELMPLESFAAVFQAIENGRADFGVVPVENSTEGSVTLTLDLLIDTALVIIGEILLPVRPSIMSLSGKREAVTRIIAHQQLLAQCRGYLSANFPNCETEAVASNGLAAQRAAADGSLAAIASAAAGEAYGLRTIASNVQDLATNMTRFIVMGTRPVERSGPGRADKTTLLFAVADRVGTLNQALNLFARNAINISKIESRPIRARPWEYLFFVDVMGHRDDPKLARAIKSLERKALFLKVLGSYPEGRSAAA
ncbi:prephenate dehydratase [Candidatus Binatus soli]|jgi:chorismate mutase/prephenate dehydratase|uniref:prephenate dehydratase n=1 Tax=Candidatus Binatus soli TaxID=1953413 RepID=UPI003D0B0417